jgi:hypothetical protein
MSKEPATNATSKDLPTRKELVQAFLRRALIERKRESDRRRAGDLLG